MTRPAIFLDRDGTLVHDPGYLASPHHVRLIDGVAAALVELDAAGFARVIITNQSGIGRGKFAVSDYDAVQVELARQLAAAGASTDGAFFCPHLPDAGCACRKPATGLHREAAARLDLDLAASWCIGDRISDVTAAAGLGARSVLVLTGEGKKHEEAAGRLGISVVADLGTAVAMILGSWN
ncbi:MAG: HAD-IIIA family hydrolase [Gemmatimonadales bacterium]|nr:HAD-IIIA family hydrolase [Gemmatimonadales bacterium]